MKLTPWSYIKAPNIVNVFFPLSYEMKFQNAQFSGKFYVLLAKNGFYRPKTFSITFIFNNIYCCDLTLL